MRADAASRSYTPNRPTPSRRSHLTVVPPARPVKRRSPRKAARRRLVRLVLLAAILLVALFAAPKLVQTLTPAQEVPTTVHRVTRGESLWEIATAYRPDSDPRRVIAQIKQINNLGSINLQPGQRLLVPANPGS